MVVSSACNIFLIAISLAHASTPVPNEQDIVSLEALVATSEGLSELEVDSLSDDLQLALRQLQDLQARQAEINAHQAEAAGFAERALALQVEIQKLSNAAPSTTDESLLSADTLKLELTVQILRHTGRDGKNAAPATTGRGCHVQ